MRGMFTYTQVTVQERSECNHLKLNLTSVRGYFSPFFYFRCVYFGLLGRTKHFSSTPTTAFSIHNNAYANVKIMFNSLVKTEGGGKRRGKEDGWEVVRGYGCRL